MTDAFTEQTAYAVTFRRRTKDVTIHVTAPSIAAAVETAVEQYDSGHERFIESVEKQFDTYISPEVLYDD